jgi:hypothetical protein
MTTHLPPDDFEALAFAQRADVELDGNTAHMTTAAGSYTTTLRPLSEPAEADLAYYLDGGR